jgi:outer membrane protein OmpA-like peptidoglycan-associated protein
MPRFKTGGGLFMGLLFRDRFRQALMGFVLLMLVCLLVSSVPAADDCRRVTNILVLFDASGVMRDRNRYQDLLKQITFFEQALPITADGPFNVGLRVYGLKVGMGCENTESILAIQPWDPERFFNSFPPSVSYGMSSLTAGLRGAADDVAGVDGKSMIIVIGGGVESCNANPIKVTEQICRSNPDLEIHTFLIGNAPEGKFFMDGIATMGRGTFIDATNNPTSAQWHAWMRRWLLTKCPSSVQSPGGQPPPAAIPPVTFDNNSFSVRSKDSTFDAANLAALDAVARALRENPAAKVVLHGFSDGKGKPEYNLRLSRNRAEAAAHFLGTTYGIAPARITVVPHGATRTPPQSSDPAQERLGRRVEFEIVR